MAGCLLLRSDSRQLSDVPTQLCEAGVAACGSLLLGGAPSGLCSLNEGVAAALKANKGSISEVRFLGSTAALSATVRSAVVSALQ
jgi:hypothetical protein